MSMSKTILPKAVPVSWKTSLQRKSTSSSKRPSTFVMTFLSLHQRSALLIAPLCAWLLAVTTAPAQVPRAQAVAEGSSSGLESNYVLSPNDMVKVKVFQEDDLESAVRVSK